MRRFWINLFLVDEVKRNPYAGQTVQKSGPFSAREEAERALSGALKTGQFARGTIAYDDDDEDD